MYFEYVFKTDILNMCSKYGITTEITSGKKHLLKNLHFIMNTLGATCKCLKNSIYLIVEGLFFFFFFFFFTQSLLLGWPNSSFGFFRNIL